MDCTYCGFALEDGDELCTRCGSTVTATPQAETEPDRVDCPSCGEENNSSAEYCVNCGSPMAVITNVIQLSRAREREPLETWRVYGIETSMVGRQRELKALHRAHEHVLESGELKRVRLTAPMGLGKSRLLAELGTQVNETFSTTYVLQSEARDESNSPYAIFSRMMRRRFYIGEKEHPELSQRKLMEATKAILHDDRAERVAHLVGQLIDVTFDDSPYVASVRDSEGAAEQDRRSYEALAMLLEADANRNPLIIVLENLQYATSQELLLIDYVAEQLATAPVLMILSWNPEELPRSHPLRTMEFDHNVHLKPLSDAEVEDFVRDTLRKANDLPSEMVAKITRAAHGNPLTVEEILRILISRGVVDTRGKSWNIHLDKFLELELPRSMEDAVSQRLSSLTEEERDIMGMAACVGQEFWAEIVHAIFRVSEDTAAKATSYWMEDNGISRVNEVLESLERKDMVRRREESSLNGCEEFYFKHRIEPQKLYESMAAQEKERYHRVIAQWLDRNFTDGSRAEAIARHFDRSHCLDHAARRYLQAAGIARDNYDNEHAVELYLKGLSYLSDSDIDVKLKAFDALGSVYDFKGEHDQALAYYREMLRYSWILNDRRRGGIAYNKIGRAYRALGEYDRAITHFEAALGLFRQLDNVDGIAATLDDIGRIHWYRGNFEKAETFFTAGLHLRREAKDERSIALSLNHLGSLKLQRGEQREAMVYFREALEVRKRLDDRSGVVHSFNNLAVLLNERGDVEEALTLLHEALEIAERIGYRGSVAFVLNNLGELYMQAGELSKSRMYLEQAMDVAEDCGEKRAIFDILRNLGQLELKQGSREVALQHANDAMQVANQLDSTLLIGIGMQSLADVHAGSIFEGGEGESLRLAKECYEDAIDLLREVGNEAELGRCLSSYGKFLLEQGESTGREQLETASEIFRRLDMGHLVEINDAIIQTVRAS